jgi:conjugal transfer pilus assembly protein TraB
VVSREGSLTTQAFLAGLVSSAGSAINGAFDQPVISDSGRENPSAGEIGLRGLGGGAEQAGTTVSEYLIERAEQYQPVIEMPTGAAVEVVFLDGTFVRN